jgi:Bacterial Ig-like domain (group 3)
LIDSLSCAPDGHCAAAGEYSVATAGFAAFVVDGANGTWGRAQQVPELSMLKAVDSEATTVSCRSGGGCAVGGWFSGGRNPVHAFVADEVNGTWGSPQEVPAVGVLEAGGGSQVNSISCGSAGNCAAAGTTVGAKGNRGGFVADEKNGTWQQARALSGTGTLSAVTDLEPQSVSCGRAGNCVAGGQTHTSSADQAFVASEVNGSWHKAREVPGSAALNKGGFAEVESNCAAGGWYSVNNGDDVLPFVADESAVTGARLGLSATTIKFGHEQGEKISVTVSSRTGGTPAGKVTVAVGSAKICGITLAGAKGSCKLTARALKPGRYQLAAHYGGDASYAGSASAATTLTVTR